MFLGKLVQIPALLLRRTIKTTINVAIFFGLKELNSFELHLSKYDRLRMKRTLSRVSFRLDKCLLIQLILLPILSYIYFSKSRIRIQVYFIKHSVLIGIIGGIVNATDIHTKRFCEAIG